MKQIYGYLLIAYLVVNRLMENITKLSGIVPILVVLCLFILKERYLDRVWTAGLLFAVSAGLTLWQPSFNVFLGISVLDFFYFEKWIAAFVILALSFIAPLNGGNYFSIFLVLSAGFIGYILGQKDKNEQDGVQVLDEERRLRYSLEKTRNELIQSRKEIEQLTEIRERNRIAQDLHDTIGHSIAGVIFQLEGALRVMKKDREKAEEVFRLCSRKLSEALELTRNTVYNMRIQEGSGLDILEKLIQEFNFCPVSFTHSGDFNTVSASNLKILEANVKEALTNAAKYSKAAKIEIRIQIGSSKIRLYYHDDGVGAGDIREGLGIAGMRERVRNAGGTISIDGSDGFLIVCNLHAGSSDEEEDLE